MTTETTAYDYIDSVRDDYINAIEKAIDENGNSADGITAESVYDDYCGSITGSDYESYTHNRDEAIKYVQSFIYGEHWNDFIDWLISTTDSEGLEDALSDPEITDVSIRTNILVGNYTDWFNSYDMESYIDGMK